MQSFSTREQIIEVVNRLFVFTDCRRWDKLQAEVFSTGLRQFDMSSAGGPSKELKSKEICEMWQQGFEGIDAIQHLAGNYLVKVDGDTAEVFAYANATHYKAAAVEGNTREYVGSYDLHLVKVASGWRIDGFRYNMKYVTGNVALV